MDTAPAQRQELHEREIQEIHQAITRERTKEPKMMSSIGIAADTPTYRPPLRSASCCKLSPYLSKLRV